MLLNLFGSRDFERGCNFQSLTCLSRVQSLSMLRASLLFMYFNYQLLHSSFTTSHLSFTLLYVAS